MEKYSIFCDMCVLFRVVKRRGWDRETVGGGNGEGEGREVWVGGVGRKEGRGRRNGVKIRGV